MLMHIQKNFYELSLRAGVYEAEYILAAKYRSGLRIENQNDMADFRLWTVEEAHQVALQIEEKLNQLSVTRKLH